MKSIAFVMISTFFIGVATGFYGYAQTVGIETVSSITTTVAENNLTEGFDLSYDTAGSCRNTGCVSLHVDETRVRTRIITNAGKVTVREQGHLTEESYMDLVEALQYTNLSDKNESCTSSIRRLTERIIVRIGEVEHVIESCAGDIPEPLASLLRNEASWRIEQ